VPTDNMLINSQYQTLGVTFSVTGGVGPRIARVGSPITAFWGPGPVHDQPAPGANVGQWFLTDDGNPSTALQVIVDYVAPVSYASGAMLDIDELLPATDPEEWTIRAYDSLGTMIDIRVLNSNDPQAGNGKAYPWQFSFGTPILRRLTFTDTSLPNASTGFALDNFNAGGVGTAFAPYCFSDVSGAPCPCANNAAPGSGVGCLSSIGSGGRLSATGGATLANDTWVLTASGIPNGPGLFFQGTAQLAGGTGIAFGDGLLCAGGPLVRLGIVNAVGNASTYPTGATPPNNVPVSVKGGTAPGNVRSYQLWYRDADLSFCTTAVFNLTNALSLTWAP
jgi:hypothetical protein